MLDALLASRSITVAQLSGTSAGAINAAVIASALANGSPAKARKALRSFWLSIAAPDAPEVVRSFFGPLERHWRNSMNDWLLASGLMSPYMATTPGMHPLRDAIAAHVDIDAIRSKSAPALFVTVTNVRSGLPRVISNPDLSVAFAFRAAFRGDLTQALALQIGQLEILEHQIDELIVVHASDDDAIELETAEHAVCRGNAFQHARELVEPGERDESIGPERVEADGDAAQAG